MDKRDVDVTVILVSYNTENLLAECFGALQAASTGLQLQTIIIDNASRDPSVSMIQSRFPDARLIINPTNVGFGRANNQALPFVQGRYVLLLNTDAFVSLDTLQKSISYMNEHSGCGILGVKLTGRDGELQPSCRYFPTPLNLFLQRTGLNRFFSSVQLVDDMNREHDTARECDWLPGCYLLIRREVIEQIGLFDSRYFLYSEEVDLCFRAKKSGWEVHFLPDTSVIHLGGESARSDGDITDVGSQIETFKIESELLFFRKNHGAAALLLHMLLTTLCDLLLPIKRIVRGRFPIGWSGYFRHARAYWSLYWSTHGGRSATR